MWACEAAQASISPWTSRKRLHFLNSLQGPGCLAKSGLCLPGLAGFWLSKKRFGWLLAGFWLARTCLAETGWTSPLPGGGLVQALPLPQTKQSRWHNSTCGLAKQPRRRSRLGRPEKGCTSLTPCKAALPNQASASGWTSPCLEKYRTYLAETGVAGPPRCLGGLVEALPLPQTKQSRWHNSTHGLAKQTRRRSRLGRPEKGCTSLTPCKARLPRSRLGRPEKGCTSLTPCKAALPNQASACLVGHPPAWKNIVLTWLKLVWLDLPAAWGRPCGGTAPPTNEASRWHNSTRRLAKQPRRRSCLGRPEKAALP